MVGKHGFPVVLAAVVVGLGTWAFVYATTKVFGQNGYLSKVTDKVFGDDGLAEQIVSEHKLFVRSVKEDNTETKEAVKSALAMSELHYAKSKEQQAIWTSCGRDFCAAIEEVSDKIGVR